jgi:predicted nucleotide-binding protein
MNGKDVTDAFITAPYGADVASRGPERDSGEDIVTSERGPDAVDPRTVMVIHGRDLGLRDDTFNLLRALGLAPLEWSQLVSLTGEGSPYVGRVLERAFEVAQAAVVLFSPDDEVRLRADLRAEMESDGLEGQARPNVFFEAGLAFGRFPEKTVMVEFGNQRGASDLAGRHVLRFDGTAERRHELAERLASAGCPVDQSGTDWLRVGDFSVP